MKNMLKKISVILVLTLTLFALIIPAYAADDSDATAAVTTEAASTEAVTEASTTSSKAMSAAIAIGLAAASGAIAMGLAVCKATESIARQPEAESKIRTTLMLGLVFIETAIIYALLVVILIIFVL